jgi:hypothetical protein
MDAVLLQPASRNAATAQPREAHSRLAVACALLSLTTVFTAVNCFKAIHIDDAAYVAYAAHIAEHPLTPYDFEIYWGFQLQPANHLLAPPVLPYWIATAMRVLGEDPWQWKLSLLPLQALLVFSLFTVFRRFARPHAMPLVWMTVLSPALLPSSNLMLDVPALALATTAFAVFLRAADRQSFLLAAGAGLIAGLAMQTKYTALVTPAVLLAWGATHGRLRLALVAAGTSFGLFAGWEIFIWAQHGSSHFLYAMQHRPGSMLDRFRHLVLPLVTLTSALAPGAFLTAVYGWTRCWWPTAGAAAALLGGLAILGATQYLEGILYGGLALVWWSGLALIFRRFWCAPCGRQTVVFLLLWLSLEIAGALVMSPFPAARRVLGVVVVATLVVGRFAPGGARGSLWLAAGMSTACGLGLTGVDIQEAEATRQAAERVVAIGRNHPGATTWFAGVWGFQFYAQRQGLQPLRPFVSQVKRGDLIALVEQPLKRIDFHPATSPLETVEIIAIQDDLPWQTVLCYYAGSAPVRHFEGLRIRVTVYRACEDFVPVGLGELPPLR